MIDILPGRSKEKFAAWLKENKENGSLAQVTEVTCDLWEPYREAVREVLGIEPTADRFHVQHQFNERIHQTRREIQRTLPESQKDALKGLRWVLLKPSEELSTSEKERLNRALEAFTEIRRLVECRDELRSIFDDQTIDSPEKAKTVLEAWAAKVRSFGSAALNKFCDTLSRWMDPISRYFLSRATNGPTEGFNRGIRMIVSRAFGLPAFRHLRLRILGAYG